MEEKKEKVRREKLKNRDELSEICEGFNTEMPAEDLASAVESKKTEMVGFSNYRLLMSWLGS